MSIESNNPKEGPEIMKPQRDWKARLFSPLFALTLYYGIKYGLMGGILDFWVGLGIVVVGLFIGNVIGNNIWKPRTEEQ